MNCDCKEKIEGELLERFKKQAPEAQEHRVSMNGYAFLLIGNRFVTCPGMPFETTAVFPLKKGGTKQKTTRSTINFNYCPFCGQYIEK